MGAPPVIRSQPLVKHSFTESIPDWELLFLGRVYHDEVHCISKIYMLWACMGNSKLWVEMFTMCIHVLVHHAQNTLDQ